MLNADGRQAILDLISRYSHGYDTEDWDLFASIWADDAVVLVGETETWSATRILEVSRQARETLAAENIQTRHSQTNTLLEEQGDRITGRTIVSVAWQHADEHKPVLMHTGEYLDEFVRVDGQWRIARREVVIDHAP